MTCHESVLLCVVSIDRQAKSVPKTLSIAIKQQKGIIMPVYYWSLDYGEARGLSNEGAWDYKLCYNFYSV